MSAEGRARYEIVVRGEVSDRLRAGFGAVALRRSAGMTTLVGEVADQAQLHGLLAMIQELGLELVSVNPAALDEAV
jgi:hypothetical protein